MIFVLETDNRRLGDDGVGHAVISRLISEPAGDAASFAAIDAAGLDAARLPPAARSALRLFTNPPFLQVLVRAALRIRTGMTPSIHLRGVGEKFRCLRRFAGTSSAPLLNRSRKEKDHD